MTVIAKPIIDKKFWILTKDNVKIGNVEAIKDGYQINVDNNISHFDTMEHMQSDLNVVFEIPKMYQKTITDEVHGYPVNRYPYNPVWDLTRRIPLFTTEKRSTSWVAAGWYKISRHDGESVTLCPKLIILQRYNHKGPFRSKEEASAA
jgi:hypothetical protein